MKCDICDFEFSTENFDYCPKCGNKIKKSKSIIFFALKIIMIYLIVEVLTTIVLSIFPNYYSDTKYGVSLIYEMFVAFIAILLVILFRNTYILKEKRVGFFKGLITGIPILVFPVALLATSINDVLNSNFATNNFFSTLLLFIFVGIYEELLCRGVIQNEFIERFGKTRKQVLFSIISASLIFGCMHITNILVGQTVFETIMQIAQATCFGMVFGVIYYRTKNIVLNIFLHGFYDFGISFALNNYFWDEQTITTGPITMKISIIGTIFLCLIHLVAFIILFRREKTDELIPIKDNKPIKKDILSYGVIAYIMLLTLNGTISNNIMNSNKDKYDKEQENNIVKYEYETISSFSNYIKIDTTYTKEQNITLDDILGIKNELYIKKENNKIKVLYNDKNIVLPYSTKKYVITLSDNNIEILLGNINYGYYINISKDDVLNNIDILSDKNKYKKIYYPTLKSIGYIKNNKNNKNYIYIETRDPLKILVLEDDTFKILEK